jgi:HSP20 family protein
MSGTTSRWLPASLSPFEWSTLSWLPTPNPVRIEERIDDQVYTLRAEVPGVDPAKDVSVIYQDGALRVQIRRMDERKDKAHTEFHYGTYGRTVMLPADIDEGSLHAQYRDGILKISAKLAEPEAICKSIPIEVADSKRPVGTKH